MARIRTIKPELIWTDEHTGDGAPPFWLYCIVEEGAEDSGPCKLGIATDLKRRLGSLQCGNWRTLNLAWAVRIADREAVRHAEEWCLQAFRPNVYTAGDDRKRLNSEWVDTSPSEAIRKALWVFEKRGVPLRRQA